ncbi:hypothetical protein [Streptomyces sp. NPDC096132]|uniref:hypothetical protein n=1 Tax=Streptomyces sp. NPDC096132 TaxID=3366075 RepID=UPI00382A8B35
MSADEVRGDSSAFQHRARGGGRHAAPKKPLFTRFQMPAGKAIAMAAMPTAVLMGMGFTPTLAVADDQPTSNSQLADEYQDCVTALESADASASASPSPSASESSSDSKSDSSDDDSDSQDSQSSSGGSSSSDSGSDDTAEPSPSASSEAASSAEQSTSSSSADTATASPSPSETSKNVLETIGDAITDLFDGDSSTSDDATATASPSPSASASAGSGDSSTDSGSSDSSGSSGSSGSSDSDGGTVKDTTDAVTDAVKDTAEDAADAADEAAEDTEKAADATSSPSPSASSTTDADDCAVATDDESGVDNKIRVADDPWYLQASSLLLKGADYQGIVEVKTASGAKKKVLKYVISGGTDIGDLHQTVNDKNSGKTYHVQAGKGTTSTITDGDTVMYTESISGNLFGLIPVTFTPDSPPPLNIPLIYFTNVKVTQAGQFGGTLHVPGMQVYTD